MYTWITAQPNSSLGCVVAPRCESIEPIRKLTPSLINIPLINNLWDIRRRGRSKLVIPMWAETDYVLLIFFSLLFPFF